MVILVGGVGGYILGFLTGMVILVGGGLGASGGAKALLDHAQFLRWDGIVPWRLLPVSL